MSKPKKTAEPVGPYVPTRDPAEEHPQAYLAGQATAHRLVADPVDRERVPWVFGLVEKHLATWPRNTGKNGLTALQYARSRGFRDTLKEYLSQIGG
jgi:hypothetical protein